MKVWQCLVLVGLSLGVTVAEAQEQQPADQNQQERGSDASPQDNGSSEASAANGQADASAQQPQPEPEMTPEKLFERVIERAKALAGSAYSAPQSPLPDKLKNLSYSDYRDIRYRNEYALWRDDRLFEVQFFHPGFLYDQPVEMYVLKGGRIDEIGFDPAMFNYENGAAPLKELVAGIDPEKMGFAGFSLHYPINTPDVKDEIVAFLGASYFRLVGRGQEYGVSARGLRARVHGFVWNDTRQVVELDRAAEVSSVSTTTFTRKPRNFEGSSLPLPTGPIFVSRMNGLVRNRRSSYQAQDA